MGGVKTAHLAEKTKKTIDLTGFGEALVDLFPDVRGSYKNIKGFSAFLGGAPANVVFGVSKAGKKCAFIGKVGNDPLGEFIVSRFNENGVVTSGITKSDEYPTGITFVLLDEKGERSFFPYIRPVADNDIYPHEISEELIKKSLFCHFGANCMTRKNAYDSTLRFLSFAKKHGCIISFDPNLRKHFHLKDENILQETVKLAKRSHVLKMNHHEFHLLFGDDVKKGVKEVFSGDTPVLLIITQGEMGARWFLKTGESGVVPAYHAKVVDTTGAGDAFFAGVLAILIEFVKKHKKITQLTTKIVQSAVKMGNLFGSVAVANIGATNRYPKL